MNQYIQQTSFNRKKAAPRERQVGRTALVPRHRDYRSLDGVGIGAAHFRAFSVVNIHSKRAPALFRCFSQAAISLRADSGSSIFDPGIGRAAPRFDLDHVEPAGMLGGVVELQAAQNYAGFGGRECLIERASQWVDRLSCTTRMHAASEPAPH